MSSVKHRRKKNEIVGVNTSKYNIQTISFLGKRKSSTPNFSIFLEKPGFRDACFQFWAILKLQ